MFRLFDILAMNIQGMQRLVKEYLKVGLTYLQMIFKEFKEYSKNIWKVV